MVGSIHNILKSVGKFMERIELYTMKSIRCIYGRNWALHIVKCKVYLWYEMSSTKRTVQGTFVVRIEHYTGKHLRYISVTNFEVYIEQCEAYLCSELSTTILNSARQIYGTK